MKKKIFCFDIDNTICSTKSNKYKKSKPKQKIIKLINKLYNNGHIIKIYTARYMGRTKDNVVLSKKKANNFTKKQLEKWGLKYHKIFFGKPSSDIYIDDKNYNHHKNWIKDFKKYL